MKERGEKGGREERGKGRRKGKMERGRRRRAAEKEDRLKNKTRNEGGIRGRGRMTT